MPAVFQKTVEQDLHKPLKIQYCADTVFTKDNAGNQINVFLYEDGEPYSSGGTVSVTAIRADGATESWAGTISGNTVSVALTRAALDVPGTLQVFIKVTAGTVETTVYAGVYNVVCTETPTVVAPVTPSDVAALIASIEAAIRNIPADWTSFLGTIAPTFDPSKTGGYAAGDYVWYPGQTDNVGTLYRFTSAHSGTWTGTDAVTVVIGNELNDTVRYTAQVHTDEQKTVARANIGAADADDVVDLELTTVQVTPQTFDDNSKSQARSNIGAASSGDLNTLSTLVNNQGGYISDLNATIGTVPTGETVEGQITDLKSALTQHEVDSDASLRNVAKGNNYNDYQGKLSLAIGKLTTSGSVVLDGITCHTTTKLAAYNHAEETNYGVLFDNTVYKVDILGYTNDTDTASAYESGYVTTSPLGLYLQSKEYVALNIRRVDGGAIVEADLDTIANAVRYYYVVGNLLATRPYVTESSQSAVSVAKAYTDSVTGNATVVTVGEDKDYQSLRTCLDDIQANGNGKPYVVNIDPGTYDIRSYYTVEERADANFVGMYIPDNVTLVGVGGAENTLLKWDGSEDTASSKISTLNIRNVVSLEGLTVYGNNIRYVVHDDFAARGTKNIRNVKDCIFRGENLVYDHVYGAGEKGNAHWIFKNCKFLAPAGKVAFMQHNNTNESEASYLTFDNCRFVGSSNNCVIFSSMNTGTTALVHVTMNGNRLSNNSGTSAKLLLNENNAASYGAGIKYKVSGFSNVLNGVTINNTDSADYSSYIDLIE